MTVRKADSPPHATSWSMTSTDDGIDVSTGALNADANALIAAGDWSGVLQHFGLDPAAFDVVDDTVRIASWQQSKRLDTGDRDTITLWSYRARFRRIQGRLPDADLELHRKRVQSWRSLIRKSPGGGLGAPSTFVIAWADWQLGKSAGDGSKGTTRRVLDSFEQAEIRIRELRRIGRNVESLAIWNMGDPNEGCDGNYASQLYSVELTRRQQLNLALDLWTVGLRTLAPLFDDVQFGSVLCNHGEWTRQGPGTKPVTSDSDNIGGYLADTLRRVFADRPEMAHVRWEIPHDDMTMMTDMSGVPVALTHGHKAPSTSAKEIEYLRGQSIRMLREHGREPRLWMTAHRHHYEIKDYGPWSRIQMPSLDYGSKWYEDTSGHWSSPGTFTCLVGEHAQAGGALSNSSAKGYSDEFVIIAR